MNAEIIERLGKSGDLAHLHRVIEQLSDNMRTDREQARALLNHTLMMFDRTVQALDEALLFAQQKNATAADVHRLREEIAHGRSALGALSAANKK
jgi:hypothetical protein